jgi:small subunit ribosomal protein S4
MARYLGPVCKLCRREGGKLYLKGDRCFSEKCAISRRPYPPGQHGQGRQKLSEYGLRLREKQKMRRIYGLLEKQFAAYYGHASALRGPTGEEMIGLIERRLDNVIYRMGFASSRRQARQLVRHGHILVGGKRVDIPSFAVTPGERLEVDGASQKIAYVSAALTSAASRPTPGWLEVDRDKFTGTIKSMPIRDEINEPAIREQYVVEYYSR